MLQTTSDLNLQPGDIFESGSPGTSFTDSPFETFDYNQDTGTVHFTLSEGADLNPDTGVMHLNNEWANHVTPDAIEITNGGQAVVHLPEDTQYFEGSAVISPESADFMEPHHGQGNVGGQNPGHNTGSGSQMAS